MLKIEAIEETLAIIKTHVRDDASTPSSMPTNADREIANLRV